MITTSSDETLPTTSEDDEDEFAEGRVVYRMHRRRERSQKLVARKKRAVLESGARLVCEVCGFDFAARRR